ncbi:MAG: prephenate dehydratase [Burkholderiaceae bacterium]|nr:prephenate dehydratase [Burkholderiaceae bacterium]
MTFAVVGLGLIGGSYAKALRRLGVKRIFGYNRTRAVAEKAVQAGIIDAIVTDDDPTLKEADVIIMAVYPTAIVDFIERNHEHLNPNVLITDAAGIKEDLGSQVRKALKGIGEFISGHPMAGREGRGLALASAEIFDGANYIVVVEPENTPEAATWLEAFALAIGFGHTVRATPDEHDRIIAYTSDLPHITAVALMNSSSFNEKTKYFSAGSFRDGTRVAAINSDLWTELFLSNADKVVDEIDHYTDQLHEWRDAIATHDEAHLKAMMEASSGRKAQMQFKNPPKVAEPVRSFVKNEGLMRIACFGAPGSFTHQALDEYFESETYDRIHFNHFEDIIEALAQGAVDYGVLPIENSSTGGITEVYDLLRQHDCAIVGERRLKIEQNLLGLPDATLGDIRQVYSHPQGLKQSQHFLKDHPEIEPVPYYSTSKSAEMVAHKEDVSLAAVAGKKAAELYGLKVLLANINHNENNTTRFVIVAPKAQTVTDANKITVVLTVKHEPGSLYKTLGYFYHGGLNLMNLESRPLVGKSWEYFFHIDLKGNLNDPAVKEALENVRNNCTFLKILGNYREDGRP